MNSNNSRKTQNIFITLLAAASVGIGAYAWKQYQDLIVLRTVALTQAQIDALKKAKDDAEKKALQLTAQIETAKSAVVNVPQNGRGAAAGAGRAQNANAQQNQAQQQAQIAQQQAQLQAVMATPEYQKAAAASQGAAIDLQYATFFRNAGIPPDMASQVKGLLVDRAAAIQDTQAAARDAGVTGAALQTLLADAQAQSDQALASALGDKYAAYQTYQQTLGRRSEAASYQIALTMSGVPMTPDQSEALITALAAQPAGRGGGGGAGAIGGGGRTVTVNTTVQNISANNLVAASSVLSPAQVQVLQAMQQSQQATAQLNQLTAGARTAGAAAAGGDAAATGGRAAGARTTGGGRAGGGRAAAGGTRTGGG